MSGEHVTDLLPAYALGTLDEADLLVIARHLPGCPACRGELAEWYRVAEALPAAVPLHEPPADLRAHVVERVERSSRTASAAYPSPAAQPAVPEVKNRPVAAPRIGWWESLLAWLTPRRALGLAVLVLVLLMASSNLLLLGQINALRAGAHPGEMQLIRMSGTDAAPLATGYMIAFPGERDGSLTVDELPELDSAHQYQIWLIKDGKRDSGGVFSVNADGYGVLHITARQPLDSYDGFGITIEPAGGSPGPTGKKVLGTDL